MSEKIDLTHIMSIKEAFDSADIDKEGSLSLEEFTLAFGKILGKGMTAKELEQLFMKIDADSGGSVDWSEFMNF